MRKWFSDTDVRDDIQVIEEMVDYLEANQIERLVTPDRIVGCPHEEGIDYPDGEVCPECPYWANRNRFTGELLS